MNVTRLKARIQAALSDDLRHPKYRGSCNVAGHCYVASEAFYHAVGGAVRGYRPMFIRHEDSPHWWVMGPRGYVHDITAAQFRTHIPYELSRGKGFLTLQPSRRCRLLLARL